MTERLYYADSYLTDFNAQVLEYDAARRRVYLDQTAFYPTSGGQQFDTGTLAGGSSALAVVDVVDEGERIAHVLAEGAPALAAGGSLAGHVDWARRFDHMQQHSGQHLLSAVFQELLGLGTLSVHFGAESSTLDLEAAALSPEQLRTVEERANRMVFENREVSAVIEDAAQVSGLRKASTRTGALRVVNIAGLDRSACGGTHVRRTGEIGPILLRRLDRVRKNVRIEFLCGGRATGRARSDYEVLSRLSGLLSTSIDELPALLGTRLDEFAQQGKQVRELSAQLDDLRARELHSRARSARSSDADLACHFEQRGQGTLQELRGLGQSYAAQPRGVFVGVLQDPPSLLVAASEDSGIDAAALVRGALGASGGRGGGTARLAQGTLPNAGALEAALAVIRPGLGLPSAGTTAS